MTTDFRVGDEVIFGRPNGEHTRARVVRINRTTISVEQTESRGGRRVREAGTVWNVHPSFVRHIGTAQAVEPARVASVGAFHVGDRVEWNDRSGRVMVGTVKRVNTKTISTIADGDPEGRYWRVPNHMLRAASGM